MAVITTTLSGVTVASGFHFPYATALGVLVPSMAAAQIRVQAAVASAGPYGDIFRADGAGTPFVVFSGPGPGAGVVPFVPSPYLRLYVSTPTDTLSFTVVPLVR